METLNHGDVNRAISIPVVESSQVAEARRVALVLSARLGFDATEAANLAIVVTEAATNLIKHGGGSEVLLRPVDEQEAPGAKPEIPQALDVVAIDQGKGMANFAEELRDGYSTVPGSTGIGLGAISRLSASLDVYSNPGKGTALVARCHAKRRAAETTLQIDGFSVPADGEEACGDAWRACHTENGATILVVDGLGHGPEAAEAADAATAVFKGRTTLAIPLLLEALHEGLRHTRGAAGAVARIDAEKRTLTFGGVGNIAGAVMDDEHRQGLVSMNGTLGQEARGFREFTYAWPAGALLVLHSDGINTQWNLEDYPGLPLRPASLIAAVLYRDFQRIRDDRTVVVARQRREF